MSEAITEERSLESYFIDWESEVFGFGYGTGEPHVLAALHKFFSLCPPPEVRDRNYDYLKLEAALTPTVAWLLINAMGKADVIEYGTSPRFGWLTPKGYRVREFVLSKTPDVLCDLVCSATQEHFFCGPWTCNCGPYGYEPDKACPNPFFHDSPTTRRKV